MAIHVQVKDFTTTQRQDFCLLYGILAASWALKLHNFGSIVVNLFGKEDFVVVAPDHIQLTHEGSFALDRERVCFVERVGCNCMLVLDHKDKLLVGTKSRGEKLRRFYFVAGIFTDSSFTFVELRLCNGTAEEIKSVVLSQMIIEALHSIVMESPRIVIKAHQPPLPFSLHKHDKLRPSLVITLQNL